MVMTFIGNMHNQILAKIKYRTYGLINQPTSLAWKIRMLR